MQVSGKQGARSAIAWHPEGTDLAVPGPDSDVVFYERHNWESSQELHGEHSGPVSVLAFSPNGRLPPIRTWKPLLCHSWDSVVRTTTSAQHSERLMDIPC